MLQHHRYVSNGKGPPTLIDKHCVTSMLATKFHLVEIHISSESVYLLTVQSHLFGNISQHSNE